MGRNGELVANGARKKEKQPRMEVENVDDEGEERREEGRETILLLCFCREEQIRTRGSTGRELSGCFLSGWRTMIRVCACLCVGGCVCLSVGGCIATSTNICIFLAK